MVQKTFPLTVKLLQVFSIFILIGALLGAKTSTIWASPEQHGTRTEVPQEDMRGTDGAGAGAGKPSGTTGAGGSGGFGDNTGVQPLREGPSVKIDDKTNRVQSFESPGPGWQMKPPMAMPQQGPPEWIRSRVTSMDSPGDDYEMEIISAPRMGPPTWVPKGSQGLNQPPANPFAHPMPTLPGTVSGDGQAMRGSFSEVSGLEVETPEMDYRTGADESTTRKIPGMKKFKNIEMKRGIVSKEPPKIDDKPNRVQSFESPGPGWQMKPPMAMPQQGPPEWIQSRVTSMDSPGDDYEMEIISAPRMGPPTWVPKGSQNLQSAESSKGK